MKPTARTVTALTLACALLPGAAASGAAADARKARLSGKDLPSVAAMATVYPFLSGGDRTVIRTETFDINGAGDCVAIKTIGRPAQAVWSTYSTASGDDPYFVGQESAAPFVHRFRTRAKAAKTMRKLRSYVARCAGAHGDGEGTSNVLQPLTPPALGDEAVAYSISWVRPNVITGTSESRELHVVARDGRQLVDVYAQAETFTPSLDRAAQVAALTLAR